MFSVLISAHSHTVIHISLLSYIYATHRSVVVRLRMSEGAGIMRLCPLMAPRRLQSVGRLREDFWKTSESRPTIYDRFRIRFSSRSLAGASVRPSTDEAVELRSRTTLTNRRRGPDLWAIQIDWPVWMCIIENMCYTSFPFILKFARASATVRGGYEGKVDIH